MHQLHGWSLFWLNNKFDRNEGTESTWKIYNYHLAITEGSMPSNWLQWDCQYVISTLVE